MTQKNWIAAAVGVLALTACGESGERYVEADMATSESAMALDIAPPPPAPVMSAPKMEARFVQEEQFNGVVQTEQGQPAAIDAVTARQIAYTYSYGFKVPTGNLEALMSAHRNACEGAGPDTCYVENSNVSGLGEDYASGYLRIRAANTWIENFKIGLESSIEPFEASLDSSNQSAEDLTAQIVDTTATLNSRKTLRDRLQRLLAERPGKLSDLLEIERELARVQQQIDSTESILAAMKLRVSMSILTLQYEPKYSAASESIWRPLGNSFDNFLENIVRSIAGLVTFISEWLVGLVVLGGVIWFGVWRLRRRTPKTDKKPSTAQTS